MSVLCVLRHKTFMYLINCVFINIIFIHNICELLSNFIYNLLRTFFVPCLHKHSGTGKWIFNATFCIRVRRSSSRTSKAFIQSGNTFTVRSEHGQRVHSSVRAQTSRICNSVKSLCEYTLFSKSEDHLFVQSMHVRSTRTIITHCRDSRNTISYIIQ